MLQCCDGKCNGGLNRRSVWGTNVGETKMTTSLGNVVCTTAKMTGEVTTNSGTLIEGDITTASFTGTGKEGDCTSSWTGDVKVTIPSLPWCIKSTKTAHQFEVRGGNCPEASRAMTFILDFTSGFSCRYERSNVTGSFTTHSTGDAILTISEVTFTKEPGDGPIKTFTLRGIKDSPPYMHDGRLLTLGDTVEFFNLVLGLRLTQQEKDALPSVLHHLQAVQALLAELTGAASAGPCDEFVVARQREIGSDPLEGQKKKSFRKALPAHASVHYVAKKL